MARVERKIQAGDGEARSEFDGARGLVADLPEGDRLRAEVIAAADAYSRWATRLITQKTTESADIAYGTSAPTGLTRRRRTSVQGASFT